MEWATDIFDESINKDSLHAFCGIHQTNPSTSIEVVESDVDDNGDVDRAIAISLSEEIQRYEMEKEAQLKEDEQLAIAIQQSLNLEGSSEGESEHDSPEFEDCQSDHEEDEIEDSIPEQEIEEIKDSVPVEEQIEINPPRSYQNFDQRSYDTHCDVCKYYIPKNPYGHLECRSHPFWLQKYCTSHEHDGTPRCCSCERLKSYDSIFIGLDDGRKLCLECHDSAIMDTNGCQPLYLEIKKFYEGLGMKLEQQVPLLLVERQALNEAREGEKDEHHDMLETRGICLSEEQSIRQDARRPQPKGGPSNDNVETKPPKIKRHCEVTAILILHGLPRLLTGTILTHELMHAWLRLQGYPTLRPEVEEGICQVMALTWLEIELRTDECIDSHTEKSFGQFLKQSIVADASPAYGDGFRVGWQAAREFGLRRTLDHIRETGNFPH